MKSQEQANRETWLNKATNLIRPYFKAAGRELHHSIRISVGFPLGGFEKIAGQCFARRVSKDNTNEIFLSPLVDDAWRAFDILVHELCHAQDDCASGHGKAFGELARALHLEGKLTATAGGATFKREFADIIKALGDYPHAALRPSRIKRQGTRLVKCECKACGYTVRTTAKWIDAQGAPLCPCNEAPMEVKTKAAAGAAAIAPKRAPQPIPRQAPAAAALKAPTPTKATRPTKRKAAPRWEPRAQELIPHNGKTAAEYVADFDRLNNLVPAPIVWISCPAYG